MSEKVTLCVYDLTQGMARGMSMALVGMQIDAIYHTSICCYGVEYFFGGGICREIPKMTPYGKPIEELPLGETELPQELLEEYLADISHKYTAEKYNLIEHNCNMFTNDIAEFLTGKGIDRKYVDQAKNLIESPMGQMFKPMLMGLQGNIQNPPPGAFK